MMPTLLAPARRALLALAGSFLLCAGTASNYAHAATLSESEFAQIRLEAQTRIAQDAASAAPWQSLDRDKLGRLLAMPAFAGLDDKLKQKLLYQAAAWELMPFAAPSEAQAMWARWYPERGIDRQFREEDRSTDRPDVLYGDASWGKEASANVALLHCLAPAAWRVREMDPMLWALERGNGWEVANAFDFGECVRQQTQDGNTYAASRGGHHTPRGQSSADVLAQKFSDYLVQHRCSGTGPDSCLALLHALVSLDPAHPALPEVLRALEPEFVWRVVAPLPTDFAARINDFSEEELSALQATRHEIARQSIFLTAKIKHLLRQPDQWPEGELARSLRKTYYLWALNNKIERAGTGFLIELERREFSNAFALLPARGGAALGYVPLWQELGRLHAARPGCSNNHLGEARLPLEFWVSYAIVKLEREQTTCSALRGDILQIGKLYADAALRGDSAALQALAGLRPFLKHPGAARDDVAMSLGEECGKLRRARRDPWRVCPLARSAAARYEASL